MVAVVLRSIGSVLPFVALSTKGTTTMPRTIEIEATWRSVTRVTVADDWEAPDEGAFQLGVDIDGAEIADQVDALGAELTDWTVR